MRRTSFSARTAQARWDYTRTRVDRCPFGKDKPTCFDCTVHCFQREMRDRIRAVMRYAGPRMSARHPLISLLHLIDGRRPPPRKAKIREIARVAEHGEGWGVPAEWH